jgi:DUF4097 and DUF4098 domain-containing protein YvlB
MRRESFTVTGPLVFDVATSSGDIEIVASDAGKVVVELRGGPADSYVVELHGSDLNVHPPTRSSGKRRYASTHVRVFVPDGAGGRLRTSSGDIQVAPSLNALTLATASGDCRVHGSVAADVAAKTASGDVRLGNVGGSLVATTASGGIVVDEVGADFRLDSASGDARVSAVAGSVEAKMVSGDLTVGSAAGASVRVRSLSGDVRLGIPPGRTVDLDMQTVSGSLINRIEKCGEISASRRSLAISMKSVSGSLRLENV